MAYGLFLFIRDICDGDLVGWIDKRLQAVPDRSSPDYPKRLGQALIGPMQHVFGVSHKVLNMTLADLLIGADPDRSLWVLAGQHMIAIDTLIHNLLHRTGTLAECRAEHAYGPACYAPRGCASSATACPRDRGPRLRPELSGHLPPVCAACSLGLLRPRRAGGLQRQSGRGQPGLREQQLPRVQDLCPGATAA
jgi:hypothetical protein